MRALPFAVLAGLAFLSADATAQGGASGTLVAIFAHPDDEASVAPILARYARQGVQVYLISATDGNQGGAHITIPRGEELGRVRMQEIRCATDALGIHPPIMLGFPDGRLGDNAVLFPLMGRVHEEILRLHPDAIITWGPDGATGHPDHRLISSIVTQLTRSGAPGTTERLFYATLPVEGMRAMNPGRGDPGALVPQPRYFSVRVAFTSADFDAARRAMTCHKTQYSDEIVQRVSEISRNVWNGQLPLAPWFSTAGETDLFR